MTTACGHYRPQLETSRPEGVPPTGYFWTTICAEETCKHGQQEPQCPPQTVCLRCGNPELNRPFCPKASQVTLIRWNGKWLPILYSAWKHQHSVSFIALLPFTHARSEFIKRWQSQTPTSYSSEEGVVAGHSGQFTPDGYLSAVIHRLTLRPQPTTRTIWKLVGNPGCQPIQL